MPAYKFLGAAMMIAGFSMWVVSDRPEGLGYVVLAMMMNETVDITKRNIPIRLPGAEGRAMNLLWEHLSAEQCAQVVKFDHFIVRSASGRIYAIGALRGEALRFLGSEEQLASTLTGLPPFGSLWHRYCIGHKQAGIIDMPRSDTALWLKLMIESDETMFLAVAQ